MEITRLRRGLSNLESMGLQLESKVMTLVFKQIVLLLNL